MRKILSTWTIALCLLATPITSTIALAARVKLYKPNDFSYKFNDQRISLVLKPNQVAIAFKPATTTRSFGEPVDYIKLQKALRGEGGTRDLGVSENLNVELKPLGDRYAVITLPTTRLIDFQQKLTNRLEQSYVQTTLPVFQRKNAAADSPETIVLHDEMVVTVEPGLSKTQIDEIFNRYDVEAIRPLRFSKNRYLVRSRSATGAGILPIVDQLGSTTGIQSASPNLIQSIGYHPNRTSPPPSPQETPIDLQQRPNPLAPTAGSPYPDSLFPYQWHLDSRKRKPLGARTDVRAAEAWGASNKGQGAIVAVLDSTIQWDHPDLQESLYEVPQNLPDLLPGERFGWDFSSWGSASSCLKKNPKSCVSGDNDTRLSKDEMAALQPTFQTMFQSDERVLKSYPKYVATLRRRDPQMSDANIAEKIRDYILKDISGEFHGTWVSGVIAATPKDSIGAVGVAPNAKILPVRVFGLGGKYSVDGFIEAIGYAAARKVDVINLSLGGILPTQAEADQIFSILDEHPNLVIVASSGNDDTDGAGYPAAIAGVLSVGSSNLEGNRSGYSNYGRRLDVVAPGGDLSVRRSGGILTTGGTFMTGFWDGLAQPKSSWGYAFDPIGKYVQVEGTSFSSPTVAGVVALMKGADPQRKLTRTQILDIIRGTASYQPLKVTQKEKNYYRLQKSNPWTGIPGTDKIVFGSGATKPGEMVPIEQYYFGTGLVNATAAVDRVKQQVNTSQP